MPVGQISAQIRPNERMSLAAYYQYEWRKTRLNAAGSYFSSFDMLDAGGERLFADASGDALFRGRDITARNSGQWGLALRYRPERTDVEFGLYFIRFNEKLPQLYLYPGAAPDPGIGKIGEYALVYPEDIRVIGASFSTTVGNAGVAGEIHVRRNTPLASTPQTVQPGDLADNRSNPLYAVGNTVHAQLSTTYVMRSSRLWDTASLIAEVGMQRYTSITRNAGAFDPARNRQAWGFRMLFTPTDFQVAPGLDLSLPIQLGYNPQGKSPLLTFNGGANRGGDVSIGISGEYRKAWNGSLQFTHYYGASDFQVFKDRDFVSLSIQRIF